MWTKIIKSGYSNYRSVLSLVGVGLVKFKTNKPILDLESASVEPGGQGGATEQSPRCSYIGKKKLFIFNLYSNFKTLILKITFNSCNVVNKKHINTVYILSQYHLKIVYIYIYIYI